MKRNSIAAITTVYKDYRFRSRLEARWAVFFDALELPYEYELEGFVTSTGQPYLPDFHLPYFDAWVEVKPEFPVAKEVRKIESFITSIDVPVLLLIGQTFSIDKPVGMFALKTGDKNYSSYRLWWSFCPDCNRLAVSLENQNQKSKNKRPWIMVCMRCKPRPMFKAGLFDHPDLVGAYKAARAARFEFGESGK